MPYLKRIGIITFSLAFSTFLFISSCTERNEEEYYEVAQTEIQDTLVQISFQNDVFPIISANCTGCHLDGGQSGGISLDTYGEFSTNVDAVIESISGNNNTMPQGGQKLPEAKTNLIKTWKDQGKKDN